MDCLTPNLMVNDVKETVEYYKKILGFIPVMTLPEKEPFSWALLQSGNVAIMVQEKKSLTEEYPQMKTMIGGSFSLYIKTSNLDGFFQKIKDKTKIIKSPHLTSYGMREFAIEDCNGYLLVFGEEGKK